MKQYFNFKNNKKRLFGLIAAVVAVGAIFIYYRIGISSADIATFTVRRGEFIVDIKTTGELQAARSVTISAPQVWAALRVSELIEDGTMVEEGDFLLQFDTGDMLRLLNERQERLATAEAELAATRARLESEEKQQENSYLTQLYSFEQAKLRFERSKYEPEITRKEQELSFKTAEINLQQTKERIESQKLIRASNLSRSELSVRQARTALRQVEDQVGSMTLSAPKQGMVVLERIRSQSGFEKLKVGDTVMRGAALITIPDLSTMTVKTKVNEVDISRIAAGQQVIVTADAVPGPTFYGTITQIATLARQEAGAEYKVFDVDVTLQSSDTRLKPGMSAQCTIITSSIGDVLSIPLESIFTKNDTTNVYVKRVGGFSLQPVSIGARNSDYVIIEQGLDDSAEVALRDPTATLQQIGGSERSSSSAPSVGN